MSAEAIELETSGFRVVYGDWQTPPELARQICELVHGFCQPDVIIEPNCGLGAFVKAAETEFPEAAAIWGGDINSQYIREIHASARIVLETADFFDERWKQVVRNATGSVLLLGNPPWVTNSELMRRESDNLPQKRNIGNYKGIEAITGKSNFDISQWMIQEEILALQGKTAVLAMLCKSSTARRVIEYVWRNQIVFSDAQIRLFDAKRFFNVSVDACLLTLRFQPDSDILNAPCGVYESLNAKEPVQNLGFFNKVLVNDIEFVRRYRELINSEARPDFCWRSGIKHDCAKIMELSVQEDGRFRNGKGEIVELERDCLYPLLKSSDLANNRIESFTRFMVVTQKRVGQDTRFIEKNFPKTWQYLQAHVEQFNKRKSSIYRGKPPFSIFGVGDYSFAAWKVAISGLYKRLAFQIVGPQEETPVVFDDTCYFLPCQNRNQAQFIKELLDSGLCQRLLNALIFWDAKRPVNRDVLNQINIAKLAQSQGRYEEYSDLFAKEEAQLLPLF